MTYEKYQFVYNSNDYNDRKLLAYAKSTPLKFAELDISKGTLNTSHLAEMCERTGASIHMLVNMKKVKEIDDSLGEMKDFDNLSKLVKSNPSLLKTPIFIIGKDYHFVKDMAGINKLTGFKAAGDSEVFQK